MPPTAVDATGASVPVTMSVGGDLLTLTVEDQSGNIQPPISVDPQYADTGDRSLTGGVFPIEPYKGGTNWIPFHSAGFEVEHTYQESYGCGTETYWCDQSWYIEPNRHTTAANLLACSTRRRARRRATPRSTTSKCGLRATTNRAKPRLADTALVGSSYGFPTGSTSLSYGLPTGMPAKARKHRRNG